jgi:hypothetical protein
MWLQKQLCAIQINKFIYFIAFIYFSHILKSLKLEMHVLDVFINYNKLFFANSFHKNSTRFCLEYVRNNHFLYSQWLICDTQLALSNDIEGKYEYCSIFIFKKTFNPTSNLFFNFNLNPQFWFKSFFFNLKESPAQL